MTARHLPVLSGDHPRGWRPNAHVAPDAPPRPSFAVWEITRACDHRCIHCGPEAGRPRHDELSPDEALRLVDDLADLGVGEVSLIGGEPYLRPDLDRVVGRIRERGMAASMVTGGFGLTRKRVRALKDAGMQHVSVSVDGPADVHDRLRDKPGSFAAAMRALDELRQAQLPAASNTQLNAWTLGRLDETLDAVATKGIDAWQLQVTSAHGRAVDHPEILLQPYRVPALFDEIEGIAARCRDLGILLVPANSLGYFGPSEWRLRRPISSRGHFSGCRAGIATVAIESDGAIKNCPSLGGPNNVGGSWRTHGLRTLWTEAPALTYMRQRTTRELWGYCAACYYADECRGGCTSVSEPLLGRPGNNPMCHHRALELQRQGLRERIVPVDRASDDPFNKGLFRVVVEPWHAPAEGARETTGYGPRTPRHRHPWGTGEAAIPGAGLPRRGLLGVRCRVSPATTGEGPGLEIESVAGGSPLARAGVRPGDRIVQVADTPIDSGEALRQAGRRAAGTRAVPIRVHRDGAVQPVPVDVDALPPETYRGGQVMYGGINVLGSRLRTILTLPEGPHDRPRPLVCYLPGLACESCEAPSEASSPLHGWIQTFTDAGLATLRVERRGLGDSDGPPCDELDFETEGLGYRVALEAIADDPRFGARILLGHSTGGMLAPLLAPRIGAAGVVVLGTSLRPWSTTLLETMRSQLALARRHAPERVPDLRAWVDGLADPTRAVDLAARTYGRPATFFAQLERTELATAWSATNGSVLVLRGAYDWICSREQAREIVETVERAGVDCTYQELAGLDHVGTAHPTERDSYLRYTRGAPDSTLPDAITRWILPRFAGPTGS